RPFTCTGVCLSVVVPSPSWPTRFEPQAQAVPSDFNAKLKLPAPATAVIPLRPLTRSGVELGSQQVPVPSWPPRLPPHAETVPSDFTARLWLKPPAMAVTPLRPLTRTGVAPPVVVPLPSWPKLLLPQAKSADRPAAAAAVADVPPTRVANSAPTPTATPNRL